MRKTVMVLLAVLAGNAAAFADSYTAISTTAMGITGDITFDETGITFANGESLRFSALVGDGLTVDGERVPASVYQVETPADPLLENGNRLCGGGDVSFVASWPSDGGMTTIAVFTGEAPPQSDEQMCGSYLYEIAD